MMDNAAVLTWNRARTLVALLLSMTTVAAGLLPREHAHPGDSDHHAGVIHRHVDGHRGASSGTTIDHGEEAPVWMTSSVGLPGAIRQAAPVVSGVPAIALPTLVLKSHDLPVADEGSIHDPPAFSSGLRAPPSRF